MTATRLATATLLAVVALTCDITDVLAQTIAESDSPRDADLVLADEPLVRVGLLDGPDEYLFGNITGAVRLEDGSVVIADQSIFEIRMFDASGRHVWTSGRKGEGPGEYEGLRLMRGCPGAAVTAYDGQLDRITELDSDGVVTGHTGVRRGRSVRGTRMLAGRRRGLHCLAGH